MLMKDYPSDFGFSVSHTTRPQRAGEQDGVHYHFTTMDNMQRMIAEGGFIEHANVYGKYYGTSKKAVADVAKEGKICILDIDTQGARSMRAQNVDGKFLFVAPPSFEELERRLRGRGTDREEVIANRLNAANGEMAGSKEPGLYDQVLVNGEVCKCYKEFEKVLDEEIKRCRQVR
jgi:guanylate kinase